MSKPFFKSYIFFVCCVFLYRAFLPLGDEPDYLERYYQLLNIDTIFSPYYHIKAILNSFFTGPQTVHCDPLQFFCTIDSQGSEPASQVIFRILFQCAIGMIAFLPLLNWIKISKYKYDIDHRAYSLSLLLPSFIYYTGLLSEEQLFVTLSILVYPLLGRPVFLILLFILLAQIDIGNSIVILIFFTFLLVGTFFSKYPRVYIVFSIAIIILGHFYALYILDFISNLNIGKISIISGLMHQDLNGSEFFDKYPVILRPIVTFMGLILYLPSGYKITYVYIIQLFLILIALYKFYKAKLFNSVVFNRFIAALFTVFFIVLAFPTYGNAKYYIFLLPFFVQPFFKIFSPSNIVIYCASLNFIVIFDLLFSAYLL